MPTAFELWKAQLLIMGNIVQDGERYAGIMPGHDGAASYQLFLLPGEADARPWQAALAWAASLGHSLPDRREQTLLYPTLKEAFRPNWYWSCEPGDIDNEAWCKDFDTGVSYQNARELDGYARCVRRVLA